MFLPPIDVVLLWIGRIVLATEISVNKTELEIDLLGSLTSCRIETVKLAIVHLDLGLIVSTSLLQACHVYTFIWLTRSKMLPEFFLASSWKNENIKDQNILKFHKLSLYKFYSHLGRNGLAFPLTEAMTCAITPFKCTWSTARNESYKDVGKVKFLHLSHVQTKFRNLKLWRFQEETTNYSNVQTSHLLFICVVTWVPQITPLTKELDYSLDSYPVSRFSEV